MALLDKIRQVHWETKENGKRVPGHLHSTWRSPLLFDPKRYHCTRPWKGMRWAVTAYTARSLRGLEGEDRNYLRKVGFPVPAAIRPDSKDAVLNVEEPELQLEQEVLLTSEDKKSILEPLEAVHEGLEEIFMEYPAVRHRDVLHVCDPWIQEDQLEEAMTTTSLTATYADFLNNCDLGTHAGYVRAREMLFESQFRWVVMHVPRGPLSSLWSLQLLIGDKPPEQSAT